MVEEDDGSIVNEIFSTAWMIASSDPVSIDTAFWQWVRHVSDECRTPDDWQRLLAVLLGISLDPRGDKTPVYEFRVGPNPAASRGLQISAHRRHAKPDGSLATVETGSVRRRAVAKTVATKSSRKEKRRRLRALLDGSPEAVAGEERALSRWVLDDAEAREVKAAIEREIMAEEMASSVQKIARVAASWKPPPAESAEPSKVAASVEDDDTDQDVLRAAAGGVAVGGVEEGAGQQQAPREKRAVGEVLVTVESVEVQLRRLDAATADADLVVLGDLLLSLQEDVAVKAALAIAHLCARDESLQLRLAETGGLPRIVLLLEAPFSQRGQLDLTLVLKALTVNKAHHPELIAQFVESDGVSKILTLVGTGGAMASETTQAAVEIVRSLADVMPARTALVECGVLLRLLRIFLPATPAQIVEPAAAALAVLLRNEPPLRVACLHAQGLKVLVALLSRGGGSSAAVSAASCIGQMLLSDPSGSDTAAEVRRAAREVGALEALLPLLDGAYGEQPLRLSAAEAAATALTELTRGSSRIAADLRAINGLQVHQLYTGV